MKYSRALAEAKAIQGKSFICRCKPTRYYVTDTPKGEPVATVSVSDDGQVRIEGGLDARPARHPDVELRRALHEVWRVENHSA